MGVDVDWQNSDDFGMPKISTALREAAGHGHVAIVELLLAAGAQVDLASDVRAAAAALALSPLLTACPPPPLSLSQHGNTPLIRAAANGCCAVVEMLLAAGAQVDLSDRVRVPPPPRARRALPLSPSRPLARERESAPALFADDVARARGARAVRVDPAVDGIIQRPT